LREIHRHELLQLQRLKRPPINSISPTAKVSLYTRHDDDAVGFDVDGINFIQVGTQLHWIQLAGKLLRGVSPNEGRVVENKSTRNTSLYHVRFFIPDSSTRASDGAQQEYGHIRRDCQRPEPKRASATVTVNARPSALPGNS
jgi:hypothetical protein